MLLQVDLFFRFSGTAWPWAVCAWLAPAAGAFLLGVQLCWAGRLLPVADNLESVLL